MTPVPQGERAPNGMSWQAWNAIPPRERERLLVEEHKRVTEYQRREQGKPE